MTTPTNVISVEPEYALSNIQEFPKGLKSDFEVLDQFGLVGQKTWVLQDKTTGQKYRLSPSTVDGWEINNRKETIGPSIIVSMAGRSMVSMHLPTGEFYRTGTPPTGLR